MLCSAVAWTVAFSAIGAVSAEPAEVRSSSDPRERLHVYAGLFGSAHLVAAQSTDYRRGYLDHGAGGGLVAGVRLNRRFSIEGSWRATANGNDFGAARVTNIALERLLVMSWMVGPRVHFPTGGIVEPYGQAGVGYAAVLLSYVDCPDCPGVFAKGPGAELGGGIDVRLGGRVSAGVRLSGQVLHFGEDAFEKRLRQVGFEPSRTQATIVSSAADLYAMFHF